jgi:hypothetical protein
MPPNTKFTLEKTLNRFLVSPYQVDLIVDYLSEGGYVECTGHWLWDAVKGGKTSGFEEGDGGGNSA